MPSSTLSAANRQVVPFALVVVCHRCASTLLHRQSQLRPIQRLYLRLLIHAEHQRFVLWVDVDADHVRQLLKKALVLRQFEALNPMRGFKPCASQTRATLAGLTPCAFAIVRVLQWVAASGLVCNVASTIALTFSADKRWTLRPWGGVLRQTRRACFFETFPPKQNGRTRGSQLIGNGVIGFCLPGKQTDPRPQYDLMGGRPAPNPRLQPPFLFCSHRQNVGWFPHKTDCTITCKDIYCYTTLAGGYTYPGKRHEPTLLARLIRTKKEAGRRSQYTPALRSSLFPSAFFDPSVQ